MNVVPAVHQRVKLELGGIYKKGRRCGERLRDKAGRYQSLVRRDFIIMDKARAKGEGRHKVSVL